MANGNEKKFELKIGKSGLLTIVAGMTALLCAAFLFGIDVGQNMETYPDKIALIPQKALALVWRPARIKMAQKSGTFSNADHSQSAGNIDLTYHETLMSKKGMARADSFEEKQPVVNDAPKTEESPTGKFLIETQNQNVMVDEHPKETEKTVAKESVKNKEEMKRKETVKQKESSDKKNDIREATSTKDKYFIQVASLKDKSAAYEMNKKIDSLGFHGKVIKIEVKGKGILYRVVASDLHDKEKATEAAKNISAKTGTNCIVKKSEPAITGMKPKASPGP